VCQYCGCRDIPLLRDYIAEHERSTHSGEEALRACERGDFVAAREHLSSMADELRAHWQGEEQGLFAVLRREELYAEHIDPLVAEHRELAGLLASVDLTKESDRHRIREALDELYVHIRKEEDGLFPASLTELDGDEWDTAIDAWHAAHAGREMIASVDGIST
jgi:iron-sulfur cluster repair protein YtfE (RIC family)